MKNHFIKIWYIRTWVINCLLVIVFLLNTGFPQVCVRVVSNQNCQPLMSMEDEQALRRFLLDKLRQAKDHEKDGRSYSPDDYFRDLSEFYVKVNALGFKNYHLLEIGWLYNHCHENLRKNIFSWDEVEKAQKKYKEFIPSLAVEKEAIRFSDLDWRSFFLWLLRLYLETLPAVLVLYIYWARDEQFERGNYEAFRIPRPGKFLSMLAVYPFVIGFYIVRWFRQNGRQIMIEAEHRRANRIFAYISEEDLERIKSFARSNLSISEWRRMLSEAGLQPRHSLAAALLVTLVFTFILRPLEAGATKIEAGNSNLVLEQISSSCNLARMCIDKQEVINSGPQCFPWDFGKDILKIETVEASPVSPGGLVPGERFISSSLEYFREILHVPIPAV